MKIVCLSFDDGTVYDRPLIALLRKYGLTATFNLNSGLDNFTWWKGETPITRLVLKDNIDLYSGFEIASHSLTHPYLLDLSDEEIEHELMADKANLEALFFKPVVSFALPFSGVDERLTDLVKKAGFTNFRVDELRRKPAVPKDPFHLLIDAVTFQDGTLRKFQKFIDEPSQSGVFLYAGHSYDFELRHNWGEIEVILSMLSKEKRIKVMSVGSMVAALHS